MTLLLGIKAILTKPLETETFAMEAKTSTMKAYIMNLFLIISLFFCIFYRFHLFKFINIDSAFGSGYSKGYFL
jgi:hypothetical protein